MFHIKFEHESLDIHMERDFRGVESWKIENRILSVKLKGEDDLKPIASLNSHNKWFLKEDMDRDVNKPQTTFNGLLIVWEIN